MNKLNFTTQLTALALAVTAAAPSLHAQLVITNADGSDGALIVTTSTNIDLSQAGTGSWTNTSARPGFGTYDPTQWAVVFKYSAVSVASGATVTFLNNATHAPVVWLVQSNVAINGTISLDGQPTPNGDLISLAEPGPGGFRGGNYYGTGFGPGGGYAIYEYDIGFYSTTHPYGSAQIVPLIGGSGGFGYSGSGGGGGGGAILVAAAGTITIASTGSGHANGGAAYRANGSGGAIRLVANQILGSGTLQATGGVGNDGRIRLECTNTTFSLSSISPTPTTLTLSPGAAPVIFPPNNAPTATVVSIVQSGQTNFVPPDPRAALAVSGNDDVRIVTTNNTVIIQVKTTNFPTNGTVNVYVKPRDGSQTIYSATAPVSGDSNSAIWQVSAQLSYPAHTIIQARAVY